MYKMSLFGFILLACLFSVSELEAQQILLECGTVLESEFSAAHESHTYLIDLQPGDRISVSVQAYGDYSGFSELALISPSSVTLERRAVASYPSSLEFQSSALSERGTYTIYVVNSWRGATGYTLEIGCILRDGTIINPGDFIPELEVEVQQPETASPGAVTPEPEADEVQQPETIDMDDAALETEVQQPEMVVIPGTIQSVLGCDEDWDAACEATALTFDEDSQIWRGDFELPAGSYEYKVAIDGTWTENYGGLADQDGPNVELVLVQDTTVTFLYDHATNWVADSVNHIIVNVPGDFQNEIGCPESFGVEGDWAPECLRTWLQDPDGDGIYIYTTNAIPAGDYEAKVAYNETWEVNYGANGISYGDNIPFSVPADDMVVVFSYDPYSHELTIEVDRP